MTSEESVEKARGLLPEKILLQWVKLQDAETLYGFLSSCIRRTMKDKEKVNG